MIMDKCFVYVYSVLSVGFAEESYSCSESDQEDCQVCITINSPEEFNAEFYVPLYIASVSGTATGNHQNKNSHLHVLHDFVAVFS